MTRGGTEPPPLRKCVVLGIGNTLMCDDGVGVRLVRILQKTCGRLVEDAGAELDFVDAGTIGYPLLDRIAGSDLLLVLDAAELGEPPGEIRLYEGEALFHFLSDRQHRSVHELGLIDLVQMLDLTPEGPKELALVGVQPERLGWGDTLSPTIEARIPEIVTFVTCLIDSWSRRGATPRYAVAQREARS